MRVTAYAAALGAALAMVPLAGAQAQDSVADFYKGRTLTVYVGYGAGGGYDAYGRLLAAYIGKHIPGNPATVVKNMPGAGSVTLANFLYNVAPKDGTAIGIIGASVAFAPLTGSEAERNASEFDAQKFTWVGSLEQFTPIGIVWNANTEVRTIEAMKAEEMAYGSSGPSSGGEIYANLMNDILGTKAEPVRGYRGSADIRLAMEQGEIDGFIGWCWSCMLADKPEYVSDNLVTTFAQYGIRKNPEMPDVPFVYGMIEDPEDKQVFNLLVSNVEMSRPFLGPPGIPEERVEALRTALVEMAKDPEFLAAAEKARRNVAVYTGAEIDALLKEAYAAPEKIVERARAIAAPQE